MPFHLPTSELFIPDGMEAGAAVARTTHLAIGAHADDLEIMAFHGIQACYRKADQWFLGVVVTDGAGSAREGRYRDFSDAEMKAIRHDEQKQAARLGEYGACLQLDHSSAAVKRDLDGQVVQDLAAILEAARPEVVYTHNLADKHDTHVAVVLRTIAALRRLPPDRRPARLLGCEVWRDLDWMNDEDKVALDVSGQEELQAALLRVFDSQIAGGKRYDLATLGRRRAHATYHVSHSVEQTTGLTFAMDLTPLLSEAAPDPANFALNLITRFKSEVFGRLANLQTRS